MAALMPTCPISKTTGSSSHRWSLLRKFPASTQPNSKPCAYSDRSSSAGRLTFSTVTMFLHRRALTGDELPRWLHIPVRGLPRRIDMEGWRERLCLGGFLLLLTHRDGHRFDLIGSISQVGAYRKITPAHLQVLLRYRCTAISPEVSEGATLKLDVIGNSVHELHFRPDRIGQQPALGFLQRPIEAQQEIKVAYPRCCRRPAQEHSNHPRWRPPQALQPIRL